MTTFDNLDIFSIRAFPMQTQISSSFGMQIAQMQSIIPREGLNRNPESQMCL